MIPRDSQRSLGADQAARSHHGRPEVHGFSRSLAAFLDPGRRPHRGDVRGGHRLRRLERGGLAGHQRGRPAGRPPARDRADRPVHGPADPDDDLQHPRPDHPPGLHARPPEHRPQGRQLHAEHRAGRRSASWRPSSSSSSSTTSGSTSGSTRPSTTSTPRRGLEPRPGRAAQPRLQARLGTGLLPLPSHRQPGQPPYRDGPADGRVRHHHRGPFPRGRHRRPVRDRPQPPGPGRERRPGHDGPLHHPQRRPATAARPPPSCPSRSSATTARACTLT